MLRWILLVLGILAVLVLGVLSLKLGISVAWDADSRTVWLQIGPVRRKILDDDASAGQPSEAAKQESHEAAAASPKKTPHRWRNWRKHWPHIPWSRVRSRWKELVPPLVQALRQTRQAVQVSPLSLSVTVGGRDDPAEAAQQYGQLHALVWSGMPLLEQLLIVPNPHVHVGLDFDAAETVSTGEIGASARLGTLLRLAVRVWMPFWEQVQQTTDAPAAESTETA